MTCSPGPPSCPTRGRASRAAPGRQAPDRRQCAGRPPEVCRMSAVLLALLLAADPAATPKGKLVPLGGGSTQPLRKRILELAGGQEARVLVIPFASSRADGKDSAKMWLDLGAKSAEPLVRGDTAAAIKA